jgi:hypothetical protein
MTRFKFAAAVFAAAAIVPAAALAQSRTGDTAVAHSFIAAAQTQDRRAVLNLLDEEVSIAFPSRATAVGYAEGQPFVIGYLDGLFVGQHALKLDDGGAERDGAVRFHAHDARTSERYAIDVQIKDARVVKLIVDRDDGAQTVALLD